MPLCFHVCLSVCPSVCLCHRDCRQAVHNFQICTWSEIAHVSSSLCLHPQLTLVATGQSGENPFISIWDSISCRTLSILKDGHSGPVVAIAFDKSGDHLASVGMESEATICIWDWKRGCIQAISQCQAERVFDIQFSPNHDNHLVTCGTKHFRLWQVCGSVVEGRDGSFGKIGDVQTILCAVHGPGGIIYSGTFSGDIYIWKGIKLDSVIKDVHHGGVTTIQRSPDGFATGGRDACVQLWDRDFKSILRLDLRQFSEGGPAVSVRSVFWQGDKVLVGMQSSDILEVCTRGSHEITHLLQGHAGGESYALAVHPYKPLYVTGGHDQAIRLWSSVENRHISQTTVGHVALCLAFSNDGAHIAAGLDDGSLLIVRARDWSEVSHSKEHHGGICDIKFSPDGFLLAAVTQRGYIGIYSPSKCYKRINQGNLNTLNAIMHLDWSTDSRHIKIEVDNLQKAVFRIPDVREIVIPDDGANPLWSTWTGGLSPETRGMWPKFSEDCDITCCDGNFSGNVIVSGHTCGNLKLTPFPFLARGARFRKFVGHCPPIGNVRFTHDKTRVLSIGASDGTILQWKLVTDSAMDGLMDKYDPNEGPIDHYSAETDTECSDIEEVDSDIDRECSIQYNRQNPQQTKRHTLKSLVNATSWLKNLPPKKGLCAEFAFGYRGFDSRNNVHLTQQGEVVFNASALVIVYNRDLHKQRVYLEHDNDILCSAIHPFKNIVATGQVGIQPVIHIWDTDTLKTMAILNKDNKIGVCALDFSGDGRKLASVDLDVDHRVIIWNWIKGEKLASASGSRAKIFAVKFNPHNSLSIVTAGINHVTFWSQVDGGFTHRSGKRSDCSKSCTMLCIAFGKSPDWCFTGSYSGSIYVWEGPRLKRTVHGHDGPIFCLHSLEKGFVSGGKDGTVVLWDEYMERCLRTYSITKCHQVTLGGHGTLIHDYPSIRACVLGYGKVFLGTGNSEVLELDKAGHYRVLVQGHMQGKVNHLSAHPKRELCASTGEDKTLRIWDIETLQMTTCKAIHKAGSRLAYSLDGKILAVGCADGSFILFSGETTESITEQHYRNSKVSDIQFSPNGQYLAIATVGGYIDVCNVPSCKRVGICTLEGQSVSKIGWTDDGMVLQVRTKNGEKTSFQMPSGKLTLLDSAQELDLKWQTSTTGLYHTCSEVCLLNEDIAPDVAQISPDGTLLACGGASSLQLMSHPVVARNSKFKKYRGHSLSISGVAWSSNGQKLISSGGPDGVIIVWSISENTEMVERKTTQGDSDNSSTDDDEDGYESDIHSCKGNGIHGSTQGIHLETSFWQYDVEQRKYEISSDFMYFHDTSAEKISQKPLPSASTQSLVLDHMFGYEGHNSKDNVYFLNDSEDIVFHAAAVGIAMNTITGVQRFYLAHTRKITCLSVNSSVKFAGIVASGQEGLGAVVHVWNANTGCPTSVLCYTKKDIQNTSVVAIHFSSSGKLVAYVTDDINHTIFVWRWHEASLVAMVPGHHLPIFLLHFRPDTEMGLVTVGVKHVKFWTVAGGSVIGQRGIIPTCLDAPSMPAQKIKTMMSIAFGASGITYTGSFDGDVYVWRESVLTTIIPKIHVGPVLSMHTTPRDGLVATGAKEIESEFGVCIKLWDSEMRRCKAYPLALGNKITSVSSLCRFPGKILFGTRDNTIHEISEKTCSVREILRAHSGLMTGFSCHPHKLQCASVDTRGILQIWDIAAKKPITNIMLHVGCSSVEFNPDGTLLAVGTGNGMLILINFSSLGTYAKRRDRNTPIISIRFSPNHEYIAVGTENGCLDLYLLSQGPIIPRIAVCKNLLSSPYHMDFSTDSLHLRVEMDEKEIVLSVPHWQFFQPGDKVMCWNTNSSVPGVKKGTQWFAEITLKLGLEISCTDKENGLNQSIVCGDIRGFLRLFTPTYGNEGKIVECKTYPGHGEHVKKVQFSCDGRWIVSHGKYDSSLFIWQAEY